MAVFGREIPHTLLTHFNLLNTLHLEDPLDALQDDGWMCISAADAYADEIFQRSPTVLPAGESLVVACGREAGRKLGMPPIEDDRWLEAEFARLRR